jgi:hypothetical protein
MLVVNIRRKISAFSFRSSRGNVRLRALPSLAAPTGVYTNWTSPVFRDFSDFMNIGHDCTESNFRLVGSAYQACLPHRDHRSVASRNSQRRSPEENTAPAEACRPVSDTEPTLEALRRSENMSLFEWQCHDVFGHSAEHSMVLGSDHPNG